MNDDSVKAVVKQQVKNSGNLLPQVSTNALRWQESGTEFLAALHLTCNELCEAYSEIILDRDGSHSAADRISDQPLFFLIAQVKMTNTGFVRV